MARPIFSVFICGGGTNKNGKAVWLRETNTEHKLEHHMREEIGERHQRNEFDKVVSRKHFITRQDCHNACRKTHDFINYRHTNDAVLVVRIVQELQSEDPSSVIAY